MKTILTSALVMAMATTVKSNNVINQKPGKEMETEKITNTIRTIFAASDARNWKTVENSFAKTVTLDYTSMAGGQPAQLSPEAIITAWKQILPGFESTHHQTGQYKVTVTGNSAQAQLRGLALHYLPNTTGNNVWVVTGSYHVNLVKEGRNWKVNYFRFNLEKQDGNLNLANLAKENAEKGISQSKHKLSATNKKVTGEFFCST
ncbi:hypothetical protein CHU92_11050 [Flavobacterium cyanobacteriorum]|uniref:SnoaL-like domain-containing protein n=1 Tax=Flavobacterium cyanobacteriorum TaxID=2022802 RepID=A0A255Z115_9FLAO|nr:nuclear transport factor 2 family protein [Flavobacterium cyanobacteriorum]OYQ35109.1 hypothetical protein CHU92_11050 [Flavobacterium cyanobacteriorum]